MFSKVVRSRKNGAGLRALLVAATFAAGGLLATSAHATPITFNPTGGGAVGAISGVASFNFSFGNAVAVGAANLVDGQTFQLLYQSALTSYNGTSTVISDPRLNAANGYQITEVASFFEVAHINTANGSITFTLAPGASNVSLFEQALGATGPTYSFTTGTGFTNGTLIYSGTVNGDNSTFNFVGGNPAVGNGQTTITALTDGGTALPGYFVTQPIMGKTFQGAVAAPYFTGSPPPVVNGHTVTATDLSLQVSAGVQAFNVPEPSSIAMGLAALVGVPVLARFGRRQNKARA
jgi:hypothetical protein